LMRCALIYKTLGEKNCLKILWELHQFTEHMEKIFAWRSDEICIYIYFAKHKYGQIFCLEIWW
jgi:hypothetical protein